LVLGVVGVSAIVVNGPSEVLQVNTVIQNYLPVRRYSTNPVIGISPRAYSADVAVQAVTGLNHPTLTLIDR
jgi:hypothetical protein